MANNLTNSPSQKKEPHSPPRTTVNDIKQLRHYLYAFKYPFFIRAVIAEIHTLHTLFAFPLPVSLRRLFLITVTFPSVALTALFRHLAQILPPLTIFIAALAAYTPQSLVTLLNATITPLIIVSIAFSLVFFYRRRQTWAPRIFSPVPWAALRLSLIAAFIANYTLSFSPNLFAFFFSISAITAALVLMHYTTLILAADILAPRRIHTA